MKDEARERSKVEGMLFRNPLRTTPHTSVFLKLFALLSESFSERASLRELALFFRKVLVVFVTCFFAKKEKRKKNNREENLGSVHYANKIKDILCDLYASGV